MCVFVSVWVCEKKRVFACVRAYVRVCVIVCMCVSCYACVRMRMCVCFLCLESRHINQ